MKNFFKFCAILKNIYICLLTLLIMAALNILSFGQGVVSPFEMERISISDNPIDIYVVEKLSQNGIQPANLCSDEVFIRRVYLDVIGSLPEPDTVKEFLENTNSNKRADVIDNLLERVEFADYWTLKLCDILRVKAEFPINLWPNAVQAYHRWIHDSLKQNKPYDVFVRELLTSSGSNFRVPPVNFYRAVQNRDSYAIASAAALTFMGVRFDKFSEEQKRGMAAFFSRVAFKKTDEWKEEIVYTDPKTTSPIEAVFPDGKKITIKPDKDPRIIFADWLISADNKFFTQNIVNRIWAWLIGKGIIHEPDDIRQDNLPVNPKLLAYLEKEFINSKYDMKHIYRIILNSQTYQQSFISQSDNPKAESLFAHFILRRLEAETLVDAINWIGGTSEGYSSAIPEPFTFVPEYEKTINLADGSITSQFLEMFGRSPRDTGLESERNNEPNDSQRLYLLNSEDIHKKIQKSPKLAKIYKSQKRGQGQIVKMVYLTILSRYPTETEMKVINNYILNNDKNLKNSADDIAWALINTKEFLYRH